MLVRDVKRAAFSVRYPSTLRHPMHRELAAATDVSRAELLMWSPTGSVKTLFWCDGPVAATRRLFTTTESVTDLSVVPDADGTYALVRQDDYEFPTRLMEVVAESSVVFVPPVTFLESGRIELAAVGESDHLSVLHDRLRDYGDVTITRVHAYRRARSASTTTDRQRAALAAAVDVGYYDVPRTGSVDDVATELGCASSTAHELLRRAEAAVLKAHVGAATTPSP
jgi:hypothetical protein